MTINTDIAEVATVDFQAASITPLVAEGSVMVDGLTVAALSADGLLTYMPARCSVIAFADGVIINAIRPIHTDGSTYSAADIEATQSERVFRPILFRAADGGSFTLAHDVAPPVDEWDLTERIAGQYGRDVAIGNAWLYVQWEKIGGDRRWRAPDWGAYVPLTPANYVGSPAVLDLRAALGRIEAEVAALKGGPIS